MLGSKELRMIMLFQLSIQANEWGQTSSSAWLLWWVQLIIPPCTIQKLKTMIL